MEATTEKPEKSFEFMTAVITLAVAGIIYAFACLTYVHANFLTKSEADIRKESRDKSEQMMLQSLGRIEGQLNLLLIDRKVK